MAVSGQWSVVSRKSKPSLRIPNPQCPSSKENPIPKSQPAAPRLVLLELGNWSFLGIWSLVIGHWSFHSWRFFGIWTLVIGTRSLSGVWSFHSHLSASIGFV